MNPAKMHLKSSLIISILLFSFVIPEIASSGMWNYSECLPQPHCNDNCNYYCEGETYVEDGILYYNSYNYTTHCVGPFPDYCFEDPYANYCPETGPDCVPGGALKTRIRKNWYVCDGGIGLADTDSDGHYPIGSCFTPNDDCDDNDISIYFGAPEICDGKDNDCDTLVDEGTDADGDGHYTLSSCQTPNDDCDDNDPSTFLDASELCGDYKDNNCDGYVDEGCLVEYGSQPSPPDGSCPLGDPVDPFNGMFVYSENDIGYPSPSMVSITRSYSSGNTTIGPFGRGTNLSYNRQLLEYGNTLIYVTPEGGSYILSLQADGSYANSAYPFLENVKAYLNLDGTRKLVLGGGSTYSFDENGRLIEEKDINGNFVTIMRDSEGNITGISDSFGRGLAITSTTRVINGETYTLIKTLTDDQGNQVSYSYDPDAQLTSVTRPDGGTMTYSYDENGRIQSITNPRGVTQVTNTYTYAPVGRVTSQTHADGGIFNFNYIEAGNGVIIGTEMTEPNGGVTTYSFNSAGYMTESVDAYGRSTTYQREAGTNRLLSVTDALQRTTTYTYDANGNVASVTDPAGNTTSYVYDLTINKPTQITDALGNVTMMSYDANGNLLQIDPPGAPLTTMTYTSYGLPATITDALNSTTSLVYSSNGMLTMATDPLGNSATFSYDDAGRLTSATDPEGRNTLHAYDSMGRIIETTDALGGKTSFSYDINGNLLSVTDAKGRTTSYAYDSRDQLSTMTDQQGRTEIYSYDLNGNRTSITDRKDQMTSYQYDSMDRVVRADYADGSYITYSYDAVGRLTSINDSISGQIIYEYTNAGCSGGCAQGFKDKVAKEIAPLGTTTYTYDALGRRVSMDLFPVGYRVIDYSYDSNSRLTGITTWHDSQYGTFDFGFTYDAAGRKTSITYPNGTTSRYTYDNAGKVTSLEHLNSVNQVLESFSYTYDASGNRTSMDRLNAIPNLPNPTKATYDQANRMLTFNDKDITYDNNGNMESVTDSCGTTNYLWDARNRLVEINGFDSICQPLTAAFVYDALNRRIEKTVNGRTIQYRYDGYDIVEEKEGGYTTAYYIRTLNVDEPLMRLATGIPWYYHVDALGSVIALTDHTGILKTKYNYSPFGVTGVIGETTDNPLQYTGRENDGTGLYYYRARYYNPEAGRFISEDPIGFAGGDVNWFVYVGNSPVNDKDPLGLYGTQKCDYYEQACSTNGGYYECYIAQRACNLFPKNNETSDCIRQCLQEKHRERQPKNRCSEKGQTRFSDFTLEHYQCIVGCSRNPENPYNPQGPNLPDADIYLY